MIVTWALAWWTPYAAIGAGYLAPKLARAIARRMA